MTSSSSHALGIDVGTTNTKVALIECAGSRPVGVRSLASAPTPPPAGLAATLRSLIGSALAGQPAPDAIGIASMAETGVPLDADDTPLGDWLRWDGHRAGREADELAARLGREQLIAATGVRPGAKVPLANWAWLRARRPELFAAMARWSGTADLACLLLTGRLATDHTLAGRTMAYRLPDAGARPAARFDAVLAAEVGLRPEQLPDVVTGGMAGAVEGAAWRACGLRPGTPVTVAGHDHQVGAYAAGVRAPRQVADSIGTAEAVLTVVAEPPDPLPVAAAGMSSVITVDVARRALLAGSPAAGAFVQWWLEREAPGRSAEELFDAVANVGAPSEVIVLPYLHGRQAPQPDPAAGVRMIGRRPEHGPAELATAMLQGLCLQTRWLLEEQARLAGAAEPGPVVALGGPLLANAGWLRLKALTTPRPVQVVTEPEPVAAGAALVAAIRAGIVDASTSLATRAVPVAPDDRAGYESAFATFVAAATTTHAGAPT